MEGKKTNRKFEWVGEKTLLNCTNAADGTRPWPAKFKNRHWQLDGLVSKSSDIDGQQRSFGATAETHFRHYLSVCHCLVNLCGLKEECVGDFTRDAQLRVSMKQKKERVLERAQLNGIYWRAGPVEERQKKGFCHCCRTIGRFVGRKHRGNRLCRVDCHVGAHLIRLRSSRAFHISLIPCYYVTVSRPSLFPLQRKRKKSSHS